MLSQQKTLVPIDLSSPSVAGLRYAVELMRLGGPQAIELLHVRRPPTNSPDGRRGPLEETQRSRADGRRALGRLIAAVGLEPSDPRITTTVEFGDPAAVIIERAHRGHHDLIVLGRRHPQHPLRLARPPRRVVGERVASGAPCPVLTLPEEQLAPASLATHARGHEAAPVPV